MTKILVIEDEYSVRENIIELLEAEDFETIGAANGQVGIKLALTEVPDLILCDLMMPEIDGYGVLINLRQEPLTATTPFIFLTAKSTKTDFRQGMELGADDYLTKPFTRAELLSAIDGRLQKQATLKQYFSASSQLQAFNSEMLAVKNILQGAIEEEKFRQFYVEYQPQIDINSGKIIGAEALLRWQSPELGIVATSELIPLAESTGLIIPIGEWVLQSVCQQNKAWQNAGYSPLCIAVNFSARQFAQPDLNKKIVKFLASSNLEPHCLELELTESLIMQDINTAIATMNELRSLGIKIAIDDFGTGYSSLMYLKKLPINKLKIDRYFIHNIVNDPQKAAITTALIQMGHNLNLQVIAEGVETESELEFLQKYNCDAMQGFLFSRPVAAGEFQKFLSTSS
ncbi:MAG: EAL domain-containing response regulator [Pelatocladus maniniholoensis HA4357-MV3]|jgi:EAL domain-containing protein (putative c-di-GMP-specific phosphodiesterase class I)/CheY-like chemotaxis protein|uniref:EAL domain-containing response regulator n=1 Tax=Pelatocladus maniniholoensis HA4357-MV3 TaxID=1117104 RepID=A0A9E3LQQ5_9NOST|nr:EAL domain-containing response regulator [Pelatocladus maniniholoensis HA4357-MV3]BAZ68058.1 response regulator receiver modulated diguanylate phosphodiesterase [Fischerella sp. NIES-4106]